MTQGTRAHRQTGRTQTSPHLYFHTGCAACLCIKYCFCHRIPIEAYALPFLEVVDHSCVPPPPWLSLQALEDAGLADLDLDGMGVGGLGGIGPELGLGGALEVEEPLSVTIPGSPASASRQGTPLKVRLTFLGQLLGH